MASWTTSGPDGGETYVFVITAYDPSNAAGDDRAATVTITATDVNEKPTVILVVVDGTSTELELVKENHSLVNVDEDDNTDAIELRMEVVLGTYDAEDFDIDDGSVVDGTAAANASQVTLSLGGEDAGDFVLHDPEEPAGPRELKFKASPDFESPTDANQDNAYKVTIIATDRKGLKGIRDLTIEVENIDEDGKVKLSTIQPGVGQEITATLTDPDMGITGAKWQWSRAETLRIGAAWTDIDGATSTS